MNEAYQQALEKHKTPSVICCSRGELEALENSSVEKNKNGDYVVFSESEEALLTIFLFCRRSDSDISFSFRL